ncbi:hypothetical protein TNCV_824041 [Trichonephila clavipes]|nr:hypothetical protein TNCV_824041 [Trichonephila clavipes]
MWRCDIYINYYQISRKNDFLGVADKVLEYGTEGTQIESSFLQCRSKALQTTALFRSDHLRGMTFVQGVKSFLPYPGHLLDYWGISLGQLFGD